MSAGHRRGAAAAVCLPQSIAVDSSAGLTRVQGVGSERKGVVAGRGLLGSPRRHTSHVFVLKYVRPTLSDLWMMWLTNILLEWNLFLIQDFSFCLKSALSENKMAIPSCLRCAVAWNTVFHLLSFSLWLSFYCRCLLYAAYKALLGFGFWSSLPVWDFLLGS